MKKGTLAVIRRVKPILWQFPPTDGTPYVIDYRSYDIPETIANAIKNAPVGLVAITLSPRGGSKMVQAAEHAARKRNIRILWWTY